MNRKLAVGLALALTCAAPAAAMADTTSKPAPTAVENGTSDQGAPANYAQRQAQSAQLASFEGGYVEVVEEHHPHVLIITSVTTILLIALIVLLVA